jgi:hypothetical protein
MECLDRISNLEMKLGNYTVRDTFYVVDLSDIDVVLGVQWSKVAYELELPEGSKIHNVFHVSCLKKAVGQFINTLEELPPLDEEGQLELVLEEVLEFREWKLRSRVIRECLIRWRGLPVEDATWESE